MYAGDFLQEKLTLAGYRMDALNVNPETLESIMEEYAKHHAGLAFDAAIKHSIGQSNWDDINNYFGTGFKSIYPPKEQYLLETFK